MQIEMLENYELKKHTSFKIGGCARRVFFPKTTKEFSALLAELPSPIVLGGCSNVLVSSKGVEEDVILTTKMKNYSVEGNVVTADCGVKGPMLSREAESQGLSGFEFMIGFPGTIGGIVYMNASAHSQAISDNFLSCSVFDVESKKILELKKEDMDFGYRGSILQRKNYVLLNSKFELNPSQKEDVGTLMERNLEFRKGKQPNLSIPNAGSVFKNPPNDSAGRLLEKAGLKGLKIGGAQVWLGHANFIVNTDNADSKDVSLLMNKMYNMVKDKYTIELMPEVKFVGIRDKEEEELWNTMLRKK